MTEIKADSGSVDHATGLLLRLDNKFFQEFYKQFSWNC